MLPTTVQNAGLLLLRLVVGVTFLIHGLDKLLDLAGAEEFFASLDIPAPGLMAPFVGVTETVGGLLLIAGLATSLVGAALAVDMLVAIVTAHIDSGFFAADGGLELALVLGTASVALVLTGAGRFSADTRLDVPRRLRAALTRATGLAPRSRTRGQAGADAEVTP